MPRVERPSAPPGTRAKGECYPPKKEFSSLAISFVAQRLAAQKVPFPRHVEKSARLDGQNLAALLYRPIAVLEVTQRHIQIHTHTHMLCAMMALRRGDQFPTAVTCLKVLRRDASMMIPSSAK
jgi:hypothetical protein